MLPAMLMIIHLTHMAHSDLLLLVTTEKSVSIYTGGSNLANKKEQKLLGIQLVSTLKEAM